MIVTSTHQKCTCTHIHTAHTQKENPTLYTYNTVQLLVQLLTAPVHMECRVSKHCLQFRVVFLHRVGGIVQNKLSRESNLNGEPPSISARGIIENSDRKSDA